MPRRDFSRHCLIIGSAPSGEGFFSQTRQKFAGILCGFQEFLTQYGGCARRRVHSATAVRAALSAEEKRPADGRADNFQTRPKVQLIHALIFFTACALLLIPALFLIRDQSDPFTHALAQGEFYLEGELVYWGRTETIRTEVTEFHKDGNCQIVYPNRTYQFLNGQYYARDARSGCSWDSNSMMYAPEEMRGIQEAFHQVSVLSGGDLSDAVCVFEGCGEIPECAGNGSVVCDCRTYLLKDGNRNDRLEEAEIVRLFFLDHKLYAISTWNDDLIFYISQFSAVSPQIEPLESV